MVESKADVHHDTRRPVVDRTKSMTGRGVTVGTTRTALSIKQVHLSQFLRTQSSPLIVSSAENPFWILAL